MLSLKRAKDSRPGSAKPKARLRAAAMWVVVKIMVPIRVILRLYWGSMGDSGKENGNDYSIIGCNGQNYGTH